MKKGIMFILILIVGMAGLYLAGVPETTAGLISFAAAIAYAVLSGGKDNGED